MKNAEVVDEDEVDNLSIEDLQEVAMNNNEYLVGVYKEVGKEPTLKKIKTL